MHPVKYDLPEAQASLEFILEQVIHGAHVIIVRHGVEIARITAVEGIHTRGLTLMSTPYERR